MTGERERERFTLKCLKHLSFSQHRTLSSVRVKVWNHLNDLRDRREEEILMDLVMSG